MPRDLPADDDWIRARQRVVGERIQTERLKQNLTQEALFLAAGVDRGTLQALEAGRANPTIETLLRLAYALDVPLSDLVQ
ncbi:helix-turn-helix domain-containing protein [Streptomyces scabiei]|uniref:helix-turn-helix domain-containing protein n=1 Tax=Streptomyces scabiei TaxID=1930 RepID=UPI00379BD762